MIVKGITHDVDSTKRRKMHDVAKCHGVIFFGSTIGVRSKMERGGGGGGDVD